MLINLISTFPRFTDDGRAGEEVEGKVREVAHEEEHVERNEGPFDPATHTRLSAPPKAYLNTEYRHAYRNESTLIRVIMRCKRPAWRPLIRLGLLELDKG
jgi:hypothetical protein